MHEPPCCERRASTATVARTCASSARWIVPSVLFVAMPKCPVCFAAYVTLLTGAGLSLTMATYLRFALMALCMASLGYLAVRRCVARTRTGTMLMVHSREPVGHARRA